LGDGRCLRRVRRQQQLHRLAGVIQPPGRVEPRRQLIADVILIQGGYVQPRRLGQCPHARPLPLPQHCQAELDQVAHILDLPRHIGH